MNRKVSRFLKNEEGAVAVITALCMVVLLGFAALAIDLSMAYYQKQRLQTACDSAALAAATALPDTTKAKQLAYAYMEENGFSGDPSDVIVTFEQTNTVVNVTSTYDIETSFAQVFGVDMMSTKCTAAAGKTTKTVNSSEFKYLLFASSGTLDIVAGSWIDGSVHSNGTLKFYPGDGTGSYVGELSYGDIMTFGGHPMLQIQDNTTGAVTYYYIYCTLSATDTRLYFSYPDYNGNTANYYIVNSDSIAGQTVEAVSAAGYSIYPLADYVEVDDDIDYPDGLEDNLEAQIEQIAQAAEDKFTELADKSGWTEKNYNQMTSWLTESTASDTEGKYYYDDGSSIWLSASGKSAVMPENSETAFITNNGNPQLQGSMTSLQTYGDLYFYSSNPKQYQKNYGGLSYCAFPFVINGNVYANGDLAIKYYKPWGGTCDTSYVYGDVYCDGDAYLYGVTIEGDIYASGDITLENCSVNGSVAADGNISFIGMQSYVSSLSGVNADTLSIYSRNGDISMQTADGTGADDLAFAGIMFAPNGTITLSSHFTFYGNIIGNSIYNGAYINAYPLSALEGYEDLDIITASGGGGTEETDTIVLLK
jgi:Flp pilus assembly protein TadG